MKLNRGIRRQQLLIVRNGTLPSPNSSFKDVRWYFLVPLQGSHCKHNAWSMYLEEESSRGPGTHSKRSFVYVPIAQQDLPRSLGRRFSYDILAVVLRCRPQIGVRPSFSWRIAVCLPRQSQHMIAFFRWARAIYSSIAASFDSEFRSKNLPDHVRIGLSETFLHFLVMKFNLSIWNILN